MKTVNCGTCWKNMPKFNFYFIVLSSCASLGLIIACLVEYNGFNCVHFSYLTLNPSRVFEHGEVWRLISCYFFSNSFWSALFIGLSQYMYGIAFEMQVGTLRFLVLIFIRLLINSMLICAACAFFGAIPAIGNSCYYFGSMWTGSLMISPSPIIILSFIFTARANKSKSQMCCCFQMPTWAFEIILYIMCQCCLLPPWYGIFYNAFPFLVGHLVPIKFIEPKVKYVEMEDELNRQGNQRSPDQPYDTINSQSSKQQQAKAAKKQTTSFQGKGRKL